MMPIKRLPSRLGARRPNALEQERENSEKLQEVSYRKAINDDEMPFKPKHVRTLIIATHEEKSALTFWKLAHVLSPLATAVTAWKFCHALHMILRDGHKNSLKDTMKNFEFIRSMREHFRHLSHGYGRLIVRYCDLLLCKLNFHRRNPQFPSNLSVKPDELHSIAETDANNYFELAVEMFEYTECILLLYKEVFNSLDQSRSISNTPMGRCRLSPLIPCVQDSTSLYDLTVRIMFNLHKERIMYYKHPTDPSLTTDLLIGHRNRFNEQFQELRSFYSSTSKLQYFQQLGITIPQLPAEPPNFLVEAELAVHVAPVVVLQPEEPDDASEAFEASLIDTAEPPPIPPHPVDQSLNGSFAESLAERDSIIDALTQELEKTRILLQQHQQQQQQLRATIAELQASNARLENSVRSSEQATKESLMAQAEVAAAGAEAIAKLQYEENNRKIAEDKFTKLREIYQKIRDEHVALIRSKAEVDKLVDSERSARDASESAVKRLEARQVEQDALIRDLHDNTDKEKETLMNRVTELQLSLDAAREHTDKQLQEQEERYASLESQHKELQEALQKVEMQLNETEGAKNVSQKEADGLKEELEKARKEMDATKQALSESEARSAGLVDEKIQLQETLHGVQMERDKLDEIRKCFLKEVKDHEENGLEMEVRIAELVREKENLVESQDKLRTKKDDLVKELKEAEREKMSLVNKQVELYDKVGSLSSELASSLATVTSLQQQRSDLVAKAAQLGNRIEQLEEALAVGQRSLEAMQEEVEDREERLATLQQDLQECMQQREDLQECKNQLLAMVADLQDRLAASVADRRAMKKDHKKQVAAQQRCTEERVVACVVACVAGCLELVTTTRQHARCDQHAELRSTPEFTLLFEPIISRCLEKLPAIVSRYFSAGESVAAAPGLISELAEFSHSTANFVLYATAASHVAADIEKAQELVGVLDKLADRSCSLLTAVQQRTPVDHHFTALTELLQQSCRLVSRCVDTSVCPEDAADLVEQEMAAMTRAISEASATTAAMLEQARKQQTGLKLEVNESMLGVCMELLSAVQVLVVRAAQLQQEVVQKGRGGASPKDFYKRNHRWTQGLISGAKSVAIACQALMAAADAVVCKGGRFEEVIVSSREIAASSMQLVMASRVKADADSTALSNVNAAAKNISTLTGTLVATAENCRDRVASVDLDFSQLSLHQTKRLEMDTLVKVLEAEKKLEEQREKLAHLRRHHYQMAGEAADENADRK